MVRAAQASAVRLLGFLTKAAEPKSTLEQPFPGPESRGLRTQFAQHPDVRLQDRPGSPVIAQASHQPRQRQATLGQLLVGHEYGHQVLARRDRQLPVSDAFRRFSPLFEDPRDADQGIPSSVPRTPVPKSVLEYLFPVLECLEMEREGFIQSLFEIQVPPEELVDECEVFPDRGIIRAGPGQFDDPAPPARRDLIRSSRVTTTLAKTPFSPKPRTSASTARATP